MSLPFGEETGHFLLVTAPPRLPSSRFALLPRVSRRRDQVGVIGSCATLAAFSFMWFNHSGDRLLHSAACIMAFTSCLRSPVTPRTQLRLSPEHLQLFRDVHRRRRRRQSERVTLA
jgi:hypothetical protein